MLQRKIVSVNCIALIALMGVSFLSTFNCAGRKQVKQGDEMVKLGNSYGAAQQYLEALRMKPGHGKALSKLTVVANQAYEQKLAKAEGYKTQGNLEDALDEYKELKTFLSALQRYNVMNFVPVDVDKAIAQLSSGAAETHYAQAERLFDQGRYREAISEYISTLSFVEPYKESHPKISECYYRIAEDLLERHAYRDAVEHYRKAITEIPGRADAQEKAAEILYQLGRYFLTKGYCRNAYLDFSKVQEILPNYKDVVAKLSEAERCAEIKIAFVRFDNPTGRTVAGMAIGEFIFDDIKTKAQARASRFVTMLDRDELAVITAEQQLGLSGLTEDSPDIGKLKGVHSLIFGKITQVYAKRDGLQKKPQTAEYTYSYQTTYTDSKGKQKTKWESEKRTMSYWVNTDRLTLSLSGSIKMIEVRTGTVKIIHQIAETASDEIAFASDFSINIEGTNVSVPDHIKALAKARMRLVDEDTLAKRLIAKIGDAMSSEILSTIDMTPRVPDPERLSLALMGK